MHRTFTPRILRQAIFSLSVALGLCGLAAEAQSALHAPTQVSRVPVNADFGPQLQLNGHIPGWVNAGNQVVSHAVNLSTPLHLSVVLQRDPATQAAFTQLLEDQQTPGSPLYHQWLTPQQVGTFFGPATSDVSAVTTWLASQGLHVDSVSPSRMIIEASGSISVVGSAFRTSFGYFTLEGTPRLSAVSEPFIPAALAPVVSSISGLTEIPLKPMSYHAGPQQKPVAENSVTPKPMYTNTGSSGTSYFLTPNDYAVIYDINSVYTGGNTGATIGSKAGHVAIIGRSRVAATDISEWATNVALASYNLNTIIPTTGTDPGAVCTFAKASTCSTGGDQGEQTLDVDRVIGTAPGVQADLVVSLSSQTTDGVYIAAAYNVNTLVDPVMTISYGSCEINNGSAGVNTWNTLFSTGAAEGITVLVSSGDSGANGCAASFTPTKTAATASINAICSSSYATCVGGTEFNDTPGTTYWAAKNGTGLESALSYIPEGGWNESNGGAGAYEPAASGGGYSLYITKPTWQTGTGVPADGHRDVPDVSYPAAAHTGVYACLDFELGLYTSQGITSADNCTTAGGGYFFGFSGTSAAAPTMAGVAALLNTKLAVTQGNINPLLYSIAAGTSAAGVFHDVTVTTSGVSGCSVTTPSMCNNSTPGSTANSTTVAGGVQGYLLTAGYDEVTGLGSMDVANLLTAAVSASSTPSFTVTPATTSYTLVGGATSGNTDAMALASVNSFAGTVALTCTVTNTSGTAAGTCSLSPTSSTLTAGGTGSSTLTIATTAGTTGTLTVVVKGTSGSTTITASTINVTLTAAPSFTVVPTTSSYTLVGGATTGNTDVITVASTNSFAGAVALTYAVTPGTANGTASLSPASVTLTSGGAGTSTLTIGSATGATGTFTITVTGTSGTTIVTSSVITVTLTAGSGGSGSITLSQPASLSFTSGATSGNTTTSTLTSVGFAGTVSFGCAISTGNEMYPPTCTVTPSPATLTSGSTQVETITISSTVAHAKPGTPGQAGLTNWGLKGGALLAALLCLVPLRRRRAFRPLAAFALLAFGLSAMSGCSKNAPTTTPTTPTLGSSAGGYNVTVTATPSTGSAVTTTFTLTIN